MKIVLKPIEEEGLYRTYRGGSWGNDEDFAHISLRDSVLNYNYRYTRNRNLSFRLARNK